MKADNKNSEKVEDFYAQMQKKYPRLIKRTIRGFTFLVFPLVNRPTCKSYNPPGGCLYCGNTSFRYHSKGGGKKYYQCEKCWGINH